MKIARIIPYFKSGFGGPVNHLKKLLLGMQDLNIENYILTTNIDKKNSLLSKNQILYLKNFKIFKYVPLLKFYHFFLTPQMIVDLIKNKFDIIDLRCFRNFQVDFALLFYSIFRRNIPIIFNTHGTLSTPDLSRIKNLFKKVYYTFFEKFLLKRVNYFIVVSLSEKNILVEKGIPSEKILVISHGKNLLIDSNDIKSGNFRNKYKIDKNTILISCIGRIYQGKGIQYLLRAVPELKKSIKNFKIIITGKNDGFLDYLQELIKSLKIEKEILLVGFLSKKDDQLWELYKDTDFLVSPSLSESFGHVFIEGISFKIPILYSNQNNLFLKDGKSGIYTPFGNYKKIAEAIINLINKPKLKDLLVSNAILALNDFPTWEKIFKIHNKLYQILKKKR